MKVMQKLLRGPDKEGAELELGRPTFIGTDRVT